MKYKVVPFTGTLDQSNKMTTQIIAEQLEAVITKHNSDGWEYVRIESVSTSVAPDNGCFGMGIIGTKPGYLTSRQVIVFRQS